MISRHLRLAAALMVLLSASGCSKGSPDVAPVAQIESKPANGPTDEELIAGIEAIPKIHAAMQLDPSVRLEIRTLVRDTGYLDKEQRIVALAKGVGVIADRRMGAKVVAYDDATVKRLAGTMSWVIRDAADRNDPTCMDARYGRSAGIGRAVMFDFHRDAAAAVPGVNTGRATRGQVEKTVNGILRETVRISGMTDNEFAMSDARRASPRNACIVFSSILKALSGLPAREGAPVIRVLLKI